MSVYLCACPLFYSPFMSGVSKAFLLYILYMRLPLSYTDYIVLLHERHR